MNEKNDANKRPIEVTILVWIVLLLAVVKVMFFAAVLFLPELRTNLEFMGIHESKQAILTVSIPFHYAVSAIGTAVLFVTGIGILRAKHWGRVALLSWSGCMLLFNYLTTGSFSYVAYQLLVFVVMIVVLYNSRANAFFKAGSN